MRSTPGEATASVRHVMLRHPKTLPAHASVAQARAALRSEHVHMVLLTDRGTLVGTLVRTDLPPTTTHGPALPWSTLVDRTVAPDAPIDAVQELLATRGVRRVAVVEADGTLLGLLCLNRRWSGFCSDADVVSRRRDPSAHRTQS